MKKVKINKSDIPALQKQLAGLSAEDVLRWSFEQFEADKIAIASSLGGEDQVLTEMAVRINPEVNVFTLDTGRLFQETYDVLEETMKKYNMSVQVLFPDSQAVEEMVSTNGPNLFYNSIENRKYCCNVRKVDPLRRKLETLEVWVTGLRRQQSITRNDMKNIEWDEGNGLIKINPLAEWSEEDVWNYIRDNKIPYNRLHDQNFPSIGCAPCTRAVEPGEDVRAGRWWWENPECKECGLHSKN
jgi:phosphoadenosine phosphosulfate reductase